MKPQIIPRELLNRMKELPECTIFTVDDFTDLYEAEIVRATLARMVKDGAITRVIEGYFTIPYYIEVVNEYGMPSSQDLAEKIAERYGWKIVPVKETVLNYLGLSTQVPYTTEYISTGPYRYYEYQKSLIQFKHTNQVLFLQFSQPLSMVIQAIKEIGKNKLTEKEFQQLCLYCKRNVKEDLIKETKRVTSWIYKILKNIAEVNNG